MARLSKYILQPQALRRISSEGECVYYQKSYVSIYALFRYFFGQMSLGQRAGAFLSGKDMLVGKIPKISFISYLSSSVALFISDGHSLIETQV